MTSAVRAWPREHQPFALTRARMVCTHSTRRFAFQPVRESEGYSSHLRRTVRRSVRLDERVAHRLQQHALRHAQLRVWRRHVLLDHLVKVQLSISSSVFPQAW